MDKLKSALDPAIKRIVDPLIASPVPGPHMGGVEDARRSFRVSRRALAPALPEVASVHDVPAADDRPAMRVYRPWGIAGTDVLPAFLFFHGGGWVTGDLDTHDKACRSIANAARCAVIAVDYALAPERPFPAAPDDAHAAYKYVSAAFAELMIDPARLAIGGDSAGANIAAVLALKLRNVGAPPPRRQILIYPLTDFSAKTASKAEFEHGPTLNRAALDWFARQYLPDSAMATDWRASPLLASDHRHLPAALIITCGHDPLRDEGIAYADRLESAGVRVRRRHFPGQIHGFLLMGGVVPETTILIGEVASELQHAFAG
ncbi:alpha/beta hydrolase [Bradyrhizobium barranii subsp. apii]|uniref:Alpha/beta hydrolase n=1 Tax=Bradyrhizobium barranii subsp. apii TaxID=2819348 RepID=A0A8T5V6W3_9BRAD|nr:alpha/beta hydrolase [Bradyrhizobium barranii]UPT86972.1 alpha/beta hydrolase [Bradyrhizobium barranii subsp. apii]